MAGRGIANSGRSEGRVPGVRSRILRSTRLVSVHDAFRQQPLEGRDQTNRRKGCCGVSKGWVEPVVAAPFDAPDCRSAVVCHASRRSASPRQHDLPSPLTVWTRHQTTNLGVGGSNPSGRASQALIAYQFFPSTRSAPMCRFAVGLQTLFAESSRN